MTSTFITPTDSHVVCAFKMLDYFFFLHFDHLVLFDIFCLR